MRKIASLILILTLIALPALAAETVTVTYVTSPLNAPTIVEKNLGLFDKHFAPLGLSVQYAQLTTGPEQTQALASGDIQFLYAVGATSVILSAAGGADIEILSMYSRSPKAFRLFSADDGIASPEALRGKTVVGPAGTILHELLAAYLASGNMTFSDVQFVDMSIPNAMAALVGGSADAALIAGAAAYNLEKDGWHIVTTGENLVDATIVTATSRAYAGAHPEAVAAFLEAQREALAFMEENPEETLGFIAHDLDMPEDAARAMYAYYDFKADITEKDIQGMEKTVSFMVENGMIDEPVNIADLIG